MYPFLILTSHYWIFFIKLLFSSNLPFDQLIVRDIIFRAIDFQQFISRNLPDTLWRIFDYNDEHRLKPSHMC